MKTVSTEISIAAPADKVWDVLMDFSSYGRWNPFVRKIAGEARPGAKLVVELGPEGGRPMRFRPIVTRYEPGRGFAWRGSLPGLFTGVHDFSLTPVEGRTRLVQSERFSGLLVSVFGGMLAKTEVGFAQMNTALKAEAEGRATTGVAA